LWRKYGQPFLFNELKLILANWFARIVWYVERKRTEIAKKVMTFQVNKESA